jgi:hypothetical protein
MSELEGYGMSDSASLERGYRRLLACYPRAFRRENEEEILAVLMACAQDGQTRPSLEGPPTWSRARCGCGCGPVRDSRARCSPRSGSCTRGRWPSWPP